MSEVKVTPRGVIEFDQWEISQIYRRKLKKLIKASKAVVDEADHIHDNSPVPQKYRAPYASLTELRKVLNEIDDWPKKSAAPTTPETER